MTRRPSLLDRFLSFFRLLAREDHHYSGGY
jgi:hypothetical protein